MKSSPPSQRSWPTELAVAIACIALLTWLYRNLFWLGTHTLAHDNFYWHFPLFHYLAENLLNNSYPLWNPYSHGGEPFYPLLVQVRLLEPLTLLTIKLGGLVTHDTVLLFNWNRLIQSVFCNIGMYLVLRRFAPSATTKLLLLIVLFLSSTLLASFSQDGLLCIILWLPYVIGLIFQIVIDEKREWWRWILLGACIGINWQSYFFSGVALWIALFVIGFAAFHREKLLALWRAPQTLGKFCVCCAIALLMIGPNAVLWSEKDDYVFANRMAPPGFQNLPSLGAPLPVEAPPHYVLSNIRMNYDLVNFTGGYLKKWELLQILSPEGNSNIFTQTTSSWGKPSECYLYLGMLPWLLVIWGFCVGVGKFKRLWGLVLVVTVLLSLGRLTPFHRWVFEIFPPLWVIRNMCLLAPLIAFSSLYFFVIGVESALAGGPYPRKRVALFLVLLLAHLGGCAYYHPRPLAFFGWTVGFMLLPACFLFSAGNRRYPIYLTVLAVALDLCSRAVTATAFYDHQFHPRYLFPTTSGLIQPIAAPPGRGIAPDYPRKYFASGPRYTELFTHQPYTFSPLRYFVDEEYPVGPEPFRLARHYLRWNSLFLLKNYHNLVYSPVSSSRLAEDFAVGGTPFQLRLDSQIVPLYPKVEEYSHNGIKMKVSIPEGGNFYWADSYHRHWQAKLDGKPVSIQLARGNFKQIAISPGVHTIEFEYLPWAFLTALGLFYGVFALALAGAGAELLITSPWFRAIYPRSDPSLPLRA